MDSHGSWRTLKIGESTYRTSQWHNFSLCWRLKKHHIWWLLLWQSLKVLIDDVNRFCCSDWLQPEIKAKPLLPANYRLIKENIFFFHFFEKNYVNFEQDMMANLQQNLNSISPFSVFYLSDSTLPRTPSHRVALNHESRSGPSDCFRTNKSTYMCLLLSNGGYNVIPQCWFYSFACRIIRV